MCPPCPKVRNLWNLRNFPYVAGVSEVPLLPQVPEPGGGLFRTRGRVIPNQGEGSTGSIGSASAGTGGWLQSSQVAGDAARPSTSKVLPLPQTSHMPQALAEKVTGGFVMIIICNRGQSFRANHAIRLRSYRTL